jgi:hypothetical protein
MISGTYKKPVPGAAAELSAAHRAGVRQAGITRGQVSVARDNGVLHPRAAGADSRECLLEVSGQGSGPEASAAKIRRRVMESIVHTVRTIY